MRVPATTTATPTVVEEGTTATNHKGSHLHHTLLEHAQLEALFEALVDV
jgi:hypothetical protein